MHWLEKFRKSCPNPRGGKGISRAELAAMVRLKHGKCSAVLIGILENGGITHPNIADKIAELTGASVRRRNSMVHESHRGNWRPPAPERRSEAKRKGKPSNPRTLNIIPENARRVVALDIAGKELGRFKSMNGAAQIVGATSTAVRNRCMRLVSGHTNEFKAFDCTWRFADEWDAMSPELRTADRQRAAQERRKVGMGE